MRKERRKRFNQALTLVCLLVVAVIFVRAALPVRLGTTVIKNTAVLTTSYVATTARLIDTSNQLQLLAAFTVGSSAGCLMKVEFSVDGTTWYQESSVTVASGVVTHTLYVHKMTATGNYVISITVLATWYRVSVKADTDATGTSLKLTEIIGAI